MRKSAKYTDNLYASREILDAIPSNAIWALNMAPMVTATKIHARIRVHKNQHQMTAGVCLFKPSTDTVDVS